MFRPLRIAIAAGFALALAFTRDSGRVQSAPNADEETAFPRHYSVTLVSDSDAGPRAVSWPGRLNSAGEFIEDVEAYHPAMDDLFAEDHWYRAYLYSHGKLRRLPTLGGQSNWVVAINDKGSVIGYSDTDQIYSDSDRPTITHVAQHAFLYSHGKMMDLGTLGGHNSGVSGINNRGEVLGGADRVDQTRQAFLYSHGKMLDLGTLGGKNSGAGEGRKMINNSGELVGESDTANGESHAFLYHQGKMRDLGTLGGKESYATGINEKGDVIGQSTTSTGEKHAFLYHQGKMVDLGSPLPGERLWSSPFAINDGGDIIGHFEIVSRSDHTRVSDSFLYSHGAIKDLGDSRIANGINKRGQIVGSYGVSRPVYRDGRISAFEGEEHPFLYEKGQLIDLIDWCPGYTAADFSSAVAINDRGQILVTGGKPTRCYLLTPQ